MGRLYQSSTPTQNTQQQAPQQTGLRGVLDSVAQSPLTRVAGAGLGALGGSLVAPGLGTAFGAAAGYGGAAAATESLKNLLGTQNRSSKDQLSSNVGNFASILSLGELLSLLANPTGTLGQVRSSLIGDKTIPADELATSATESMTNSPYYKTAPPPTRQAANSQLSNFLSFINPEQTQGANAVGGGADMTISPKTDIGINDVYKGLTPFESTGRAYLKGGDMPSTALGGGTNLASRAVRGTLNDQIGLPAQLTNDALSKIYQLQESPLGRWLPRIALGLAAYKGLPALLKKLQQNN